jgi:type VI protein secretion system component VasK
VVVAIGLIAENSSVASLSLFGHNVPGVHTESRVVIVGMVVAAFICAGLAASWLSLLRSMRARRELHDLRDERQESMSALQMQNQQLQRELARVRAGAGGGPVTGEVPVAPQRGRDREPVSPFFDQTV